MSCVKRDYPTLLMSETSARGGGFRTYAKNSKQTKISNKILMLRCCSGRSCTPARRKRIGVHGRARLGNPYPNITTS